MDTSKILIVRTSALGDVVHSRPIVTALRDQFPKAKLGWVVEDLFAPLISDHPGLDAVFPVRLRSWRRSWGQRKTRREAGRALRAIRSFGATVAIDLMGNHKGGFLTFLSGAQVRIGAAMKDRREPASQLWINYATPLVGKHSVDRTLSLLSQLGIVSSQADFATKGLLLSPPEEALTFRAKNPQPYVLIQPAAGWGNKQYPAALWAQVAKGLAKEGHRVHVLAGPGELDLAQKIIDLSNEAVGLAASPGMPFLVAMLRNAQLVLGGDTGPLHLAHALGTPVLAVMGPTDPERHGPYGLSHRTVVHKLPCSFCSKRLATSRNCLTLIPATTVLKAAKSALIQSLGTTSDTIQPI